VPRTKAEQNSKPAVSEMALMIKKILKTGVDANAEQLAKDVVNKYTRHPKDTSWLEAKVKEWAELYRNMANKLASPVIYEYCEKVKQRFIDTAKLETISKKFLLVNDK
jgi:hypothetical protein